MNFLTSAPCSLSRFTPSSLSHLMMNTLGTSQTGRPQSRVMLCPRIALMCSTIPSQSCQCSTARCCLCTRSRTPDRVRGGLPDRVRGRLSVIAAAAAVLDELQRHAERLVGGRRISRAGFQQAVDGLSCSELQVQFAARCERTPACAAVRERQQNCALLGNVEIAEVVGRRVRGPRAAVAVSNSGGRSVKVKPKRRTV